jgi:hypothetical protein
MNRLTVNLIRPASVAVARPRGGLGGFEPPHLPPGQLLGFVQNRREIFCSGGGGVGVPNYLAL